MFQARTTPESDLRIGLRAVATLSILLILSIPCLAADKTRVPLEIVYSNYGHPSQTYYTDLLETVLERTKDRFGTYELMPYPERAVQSRFIEMVSDDRIDILWTMTNPERESQLRPIRIPLSMGLLGYRIALVHEDNRNMFADVDDVSDLRDFTAVQGHDWPDLAILRANDLKVEQAPRQENMAAMLAYGRIDYFPRGAYEVWRELKDFSQRPLAIDPHIILKYRAPMYFFVNADNDRLARRIESGLEEMVAEGSLRDLILSHPQMRPVFREARIDERTVIELENPQLPEQTPVGQTDYWLGIDEL